MFNMKLINVLLLFLALFPVNSHAAYTRWEKDREINGMEFRKIRYSVKDGDTVTVIGYLKAETLIDGYSCKAGWVHFSKNWELKLFQLDREAIINGFQYPKDTWIRFNDKGNVVCTFPKSTSFLNFVVCPNKCLTNTFLAHKTL